MKKWIALLLALVMALSLCACAEKDDVSKKGDGEKVEVSLFAQILMTETNSDGETETMKAVVEYDEDYNVIGTKTYSNDKLSYEVTYDKDINKPLVQKSYSEDGVRSDVTEYTYDENGNCLENTSTYYGEETLVSKCVSTYDANGNVLTEKYYENGELNYEYRYSYTASGKLEEEVNIWDGEESWTRYTYDEQDNILTEEQGVGEETYTTKSYKNTYENGKLTQVEVYEGDELDERICYDADGNETLTASYSDGEEYYRTETTYENGKLVKYVSYYDGEESYKRLCTYNADGKITERSYIYSDGETYRNTYSYNDNGDLVGVKGYEGDELEGEYTVTYKTVTVSEEVAQRIKAMNEKLSQM